MTLIDQATAARCMRISRDRLRALTLEWGRGATYAKTSTYHRHGVATPVVNRKVRGAASRSLFRPGDRRGLPRHWNHELARWEIDTVEAADWCVRNYALDTEGKAQEWLWADGKGLFPADWAQEVMYAVGRLARQTVGWKVGQ